jgi:hypothetical protein
MAIVSLHFVPFILRTERNQYKTAVDRQLIHIMSKQLLYTAYHQSVVAMFSVPAIYEQTV